jgi:hypothetical protein
LIHATQVTAAENSPQATQVAIAAATSIAASPIKIVDASMDPANVGNSAVTVSNVSQAPVDLSGWILLVQNYRITLPTTNYMTVAPGNMVIVHLSSSATPIEGQNVYVGLGALETTPRLNPDQIVLLDPQGHVASTYPQG